MESRIIEIKKVTLNIENLCNCNSQKLASCLDCDFLIRSVDPEPHSDFSMATPFKPTEPNRHLKQLFELAPMAMAIFDKDMKYLMANRRWIADFRLEDKEVVGKSQYELFPKLHTGWKEIYARALQGQVVRSEKEASQRDGQISRYQWEVGPWTSEFGDIQGVLVICTKQSLPSLEPISDKKQDLPEPVPADSWGDQWLLLGLNEKGEIVKTSSLASTWLNGKGLSENRVRFESLLEPMFQAKFKKAFQSLLAQESPVKEFSLGSPLSEEPNRWIFSRVKDEKNTAGEAVVFAMGLWGDVSPDEEKVKSEFEAVPVAAEKAESESLALLRLEVREAKDSEQQARQREARLRNVLDLAPAGVLILDERSRPIYHNEALFELIGRELPETQTVEDWLMMGTHSEEARDSLLRGWRENIWRHHLVTTLSLQHSSKGKREIELSPVSLPGGGILLMLQDVTKVRQTEETLSSMESRLRTVIQENPLPVLTLDTNGVIFEMNVAAEKFLNSVRAGARDTQLSQWFEEGQAEQFLSWLQDATASDRSMEPTLIKFVPGSGEKENVAEIKVTPIKTLSGESEYLMCFISPLEVHSKEVEPPKAADLEEMSEMSVGDFLLDPEERTELRTEVVEVVLFDTDYHGKVVRWSAEAEEMFGYSEDQMKGQGFHRLFRPSDATSFHMEVLFLLKAPSPFDIQWYYFHPQNGKLQETFVMNGSSETGLAVSLAVQKEVSKSVKLPDEPLSFSAAPWANVETEIRSEPVTFLAEEQLEREHLLLKESHDRIKSNLQVLSSMLNLQMSTLQNEDALDALRSSQGRVRALALIHKQLSEISAGASVDFPIFVDELVGNLREAYDVGGDRVTIHIDLQDEPLQDEAWLIPLAFSLNEMLSNAFRHAFGQDEQGEVFVKLKWGEERGVLSVKDTGRGLIDDTQDQVYSSAMGLKMLRVFAGQLHGDLQVLSVQPQGTEVQLNFPTRELIKSQDESLMEHVE